MARLACLLVLVIVSLPTWAKPLRVFVSVPPIKGLVEAIGGDQVRVTSLVRAGQSPATFEPTTRDLAQLASADLFFRVGVPFERTWMRRIRAVNPRLRVVDLRVGLPLRELEHHGHGDTDAPGHELDPHFWTDPKLLGMAASHVRDGLSEMDAAHARSFAVAYRRLQHRLDGIDKELRLALADVPNRRFLVFHPAWGYFARAYGLEQIAVEHQGKSPGPRFLVSVIERARAAGVKVIFVQPQFDQRAAARVAHAIDGRVVVMEPLAEDMPSYLLEAGMRIREALDR